MDPILRHWLIGFITTLVSLALVAAADYLQANPVPGLEPVFIPVLAGALLALDKYLRLHRPE